MNVKPTGSFAVFQSGDRYRIWSDGSLRHDPPKVKGKKARKDERRRRRLRREAARNEATSL